MHEEAAVRYNRVAGELADLLNSPRGLSVLSDMHELVGEIAFERSFFLDELAKQRSLSVNPRELLRHKQYYLDIARKKFARWKENRSASQA